MAFYVVPRRRFVLAGIAASLTLLLGGAAFVQLRAAESWASMQRTVRELSASFDARPFRREPLWGDATDDGAFAHYERASAAARELQRAHWNELLKLLPHDRVVATEAGELRAAWQPVLTHLRAGAHAADVRPVAELNTGEKARYANLIDARWIVNVAILESRALRHEGRALEAVQCSLDAATYASDLARDSVLINQVIGAATLAIATNEAWRDDAALATLSPTAMDLFGAGLERLDASLPEAIDLTSELVLCGRMLQGVSGKEEWLPSAWRYGFSTRWMLADGFAAYVALVDRFATARTAAWPRRSAMWERATAEALGRSNPIVGVAVPAVSSVEFNVREVIARMRMLRMAIALHRGNDAPALRDPLGDGPLLVTHEDGGVRITSAGSADHRKIERFVAR